MKEIIAFLFRLINFGIVIGVFYYLFKKYLRAAIQQKIAEKNKEIDDLVDNYESLEYSQQELDRTLVQQAQLCSSLKEQISQWRVQVDLQLAHRKQEKKELAALLAKRTEQKEKWLEHAQISKRVMPIAIDEARNDLRKKFAQVKNGRIFVDKVMDILRKNTP